MRKSEYAGFKSQSAMEYLMTYGWAILVIAIVLVALYEIGIFNPYYFTLKASPGSCQAVRNSQGANFVGQCLSAIPKYVLGLAGSSSAVQGNGFGTLNNRAQPFTISIWVDPTSSSGIVVDELSRGGAWHDSWIELVNGNAYIRMWSLPCISVGQVPTDQWSNIIMTYDGSTYTGYVDGVQGGSRSGTRSVPGGANQMFYSLGASDSTNCGSGAKYNGMLSNFQFYNISMTAGQVHTLYMEGIGGVPISAQYILGWWPLNGDANDYSGNSDNDQTNGPINYIGYWYNGYTQP
ncbi:MAG: LamG domain-containing protein [Candidatus Micrarchaeota archaeon]|nr:LamG domain-containing protein [Candidatus Micrarchaeota archaeon]